MSDKSILIIDDEAIIREGTRRILELEGHRVEGSSSGLQGLECLQEDQFDLVITDLKMPGMSGMDVLKAIRVLQPAVPVILITGYASVETAVEAIKHGAFDYLPKPFSPEQLTELVTKALGHRATLLKTASCNDPAEVPAGFDLFVGQSRSMQQVFVRIKQVAPTDSTVLISGESGTGKELAARAIHNASQRSEETFVAVDCTSLAENLLESELFGHIKGSFTGATQTKPGLFNVADGGTLFLDEVSNLSVTTQAKLLRVLQEREITPIGGTKPIPVNIRLIAASNRNLKDMVASGAFREDLYFRLNIIPVNLPPLRERGGDLPLLVAHFYKKFADEIGRECKGIDPAAMALLENYEFPGNVRELENIIERAVVLGQHEVIKGEDLGLSSAEDMVDGLAQYEDSVPLSAEELKEKKKEVRERAVTPLEKAFVLAALERNDWNVTRAAKDTGMLRPNFQALLKKFNISVRDRSCG